MLIQKVIHLRKLCLFSSLIISMHDTRLSVKTWFILKTIFMSLTNIHGFNYCDLSNYDVIHFFHLMKINLPAPQYFDNLTDTFRLFCGYFVKLITNDKIYPKVCMRFDNYFYSATICLEYFIDMSKIDMQCIYKQRFRLLDYINNVHHIKTEYQHLNYDLSNFKIAALKLLEYFNFF